MSPSGGQLTFWWRLGSKSGCSLFGSLLYVIKNCLQLKSKSSMHVCIIWAFYCCHILALPPCTQHHLAPHDSPRIQWSPAFGQLCSESCGYILRCLWCSLWQAQRSLGEPPENQRMNWSSALLCWSKKQEEKLSYEAAWFWGKQWWRFVYMWILQSEDRSN